MRKQTRHRFVATNYNHYKCLLPFLLYNSYCTKFAQQRKGKLAKTKIFLSLTSGVCFFALIFENYRTIPLAQNEIHLQLQLKSPIQDDGALVLYIKATINLVHKGYVPAAPWGSGMRPLRHHSSYSLFSISFKHSKYFPLPPKICFTAFRGVRPIFAN